MKNTFCVAKDDHVFLSHHIGDLENYATLRSFREGIDHFCRLFDVYPERVACDLHPDYLSTRYARELEEAGLPTIAVQHHHAHIAACLADNEMPAMERVIGVALDGTGYGTDSAIWGGEFLTGSIAKGFARRAHLQYLPLPGGEAAIDLELAASCLPPGEQGFPFRLLPDGDNWIIETDGILRAVAEERLAGRPLGEIAARFHLTMAEIVVAGCLRLRDAEATTTAAPCAVAISGGAFQNALLLELVQELLLQHGFILYQHRRVPPNDGGLCLGQAILANAQFQRRDG